MSGRELLLQERARGNRWAIRGVSCLLMWAGSAHALEPLPPKTPPLAPGHAAWGAVLPKPGPCETQSGASVTEPGAASDLYRKFECHFLRGEYGACLPYLEHACALTDSPRCSFNLGAVHHALMHCGLARTYYLQYLDRAPYDGDGAEARAALAELTLACATPPPAGLPQAQPVAPVVTDELPTIVPLAASANAAWASAATASASADAASAHPVSKPSAVPSTEGPARRTFARWLLGAGAATGVGTVLALVYGARAERDAEARDRYNGSLRSAADPELRAIDQSGRHSNQLAALLGISSGLLLGTGTTLWILSPEDGGSVSVQAGGAAYLSYQQAF